MRASMLPPQSTRPTRLPLKRSGFASIAASPAAPAPFGHRPLIGRIGVHRALDQRFLHEDDFGNKVADDRQRQAVRQS